jgi:hypothetical protein
MCWNLGSLGPGFNFKILDLFAPEWESLEICVQVGYIWYPKLICELNGLCQCVKRSFGKMAWNDEGMEYYNSALKT